MVLGTWGMTVIGTLFSALTVNLRMREMMLPTLVYPMLIPALMAAMTLTSDLMNGMPLGPENNHLAAGSYRFRFDLHRAGRGIH